MLGPTESQPFSTLDARDLGNEREVGLLAERKHHRVGFELLGLAGRAGEPVSSSSILSRSKVPSATWVIVESHLTLTPSPMASSTSSAWAGMRSLVRR